MSAIVTDQFRILNANNFIESVESDKNSYYVFIGLPNPSTVGYGRSESWNTNTPDPIDNFSRNAHAGDTMMFGRKISSANIRRIIKRVDWTAGTKYEIYRDDYSSQNQSPITKASRLYDSQYYVYMHTWSSSRSQNAGQAATLNVWRLETTFRKTQKLHFLLTNLKTQNRS